MKITKRQLRRIIREAVAPSRRRSRTRLAEGFWEGMKDTFVDPTGALVSGAGLGVDEDKLKAAATDDAWMLFKAMGGLGTDEETIQQVLKRRAGDLVALSGEFDELRDALVSARGETSTFFLQSIIGGVTSAGINLLMRDAQNKDLAGWLESDGMEEEAVAVTRALDPTGTVDVTEGRRHRRRWRR